MIVDKQEENRVKYFVDKKELQINGNGKMKDYAVNTATWIKWRMVIKFS